MGWKEWTVLIVFENFASFKLLYISATQESLVETYRHMYALFIPINKSIQ